MGLAANQARLLTLTSRMNDLELRCQKFSNQKILLTALSGNVSVAYNKALEAANTIGADVITTYSTSDTNSTSTGPSTLKLKQNGVNVSFNYAMLKELGYEIAPKGSSVGVKQSQTSTSEAWTMPTTIEEFGKLMTAHGCADYASSETINMTKYLDDNGNIVEAGNANSPQYWAAKFAKNSGAITSSTEYSASVTFDEEKLVKLLGPKEGGATITTGSGYLYGSNDLINDAKNDADVLIEGLKNKSIGIFKGGAEVALADVGISSQSESTSDSSSTTSSYQSLDYSRRDSARQAAQTDYEAATRKLSTQETALDMMSKAADTEYKAVSTEYESMKSLISENTEKSFSLFG